eukprot:c20445_g3_i1.p1 GENE.c20445_g3_i1~~c20445_g3_i1.p1  ORF type:complete len:239 (+),score=36.37 c20445_g3_i1:1162-1878(+)
MGNRPSVFDSSFVKAGSMAAGGANPTAATRRLHRAETQRLADTELLTSILAVVVGGRRHVFPHPHNMSSVVLAGAQPWVPFAKLDWIKHAWAIVYKNELRWALSSGGLFALIPTRLARQMVLQISAKAKASILARDNRQVNQCGATDGLAAVPIVPDELAGLLHPDAPRVRDLRTHSQPHDAAVAEPAADEGSNQESEDDEGGVELDSDAGEVEAAADDEEGDEERARPLKRRRENAE